MKKLFLVLPFFLAFGGSLIQAAENKNMYSFNPNSEKAQAVYSHFSHDSVIDTRLTNLFADAQDLIGRTVSQGAATTLGEIVDVRGIIKPSLLFSVIADELRELTVARTSQEALIDVSEAFDSLFAYWDAREQHFENKAKQEERLRQLKEKTKDIEKNKGKISSDKIEEERLRKEIDEQEGLLAATKKKELKVSADFEDLGEQEYGAKGEKKGNVVNESEMEDFIYAHGEGVDFERDQYETTLEAYEALKEALRQKSEIQKNKKFEKKSVIKNKKIATKKREENPSDSDGVSNIVDDEEIVEKVQEEAPKRLAPKTLAPKTLAPKRLDPKEKKKGSDQKEPSDSDSDGVSGIN